MNSRTVLLALSALGICTTAQAEIYDVVLSSYGAGKRQLVAATGQLQWNETTGDETFYNVRATEHEWINLGEGPSMYYTHCVEIYQSVVADEQYLFEGTAIENVPQGNGWPGEMGATRALLVQDLYANYVDPLTGKVEADPGAGFDINDYAAAFQIMLWELTHENFAEGASASEMATQISFETGAIQSEADDSVDTILDEMFETLNDGLFELANLEGWTNPDAQDQSRLVIPGAGTLFGLGLLTPLTRRRRRNA